MMMMSVQCFSDVKSYKLKQLFVVFNNMFLINHCHFNTFFGIRTFGSMRRQLFLLPKERAIVCIR